VAQLSTLGIMNDIPNSPWFILFVDVIICLVALTAAARLVAAIFSKRSRASIVRHPIAHAIWFAFLLLVVLMFLFLPPLKTKG
jgi:hypothetical protein